MCHFLLNELLLVSLLVKLLVRRLSEFLLLLTFDSLVPMIRIVFKKLHVKFSNFKMLNR